MSNLRSYEDKKIRYFHLKPSDSFYQLKLSCNMDILERFLSIKDTKGVLEPKKKIALQVYEEIIPIHQKGPYPMKKKDICLKNVLKLHESYGSFMKNISNYSSDKSDTKISLFKQNLDKICDLSAKHVEQIILKDSSRQKNPTLLTLKQTIFSFNVT